MSKSPYHPETMRARFHELGQKREQIITTSPRVERDKRDAELTEAQRRDFAKRIKEHEKELYDIDVERAALARALGGKTGAA